MQNMKRKMSKPKTSFEESKNMTGKMMTPGKVAHQKKSAVTTEKSDNKKNNVAKRFTNGDLYNEIAQFKLFKPE